MESTGSLQVNQFRLNMKKAFKSYREFTGSLQGVYKEAAGSLHNLSVKMEVKKNRSLTWSSQGVHRDLQSFSRLN